MYIYIYNIYMYIYIYYVHDTCCNYKLLVPVNLRILNKLSKKCNTSGHK